MTSESNIPIRILAERGINRLVITEDSNECLESNIEYACISALCRSQLYDLILRENVSKQARMIVLYKSRYMIEKYLNRISKLEEENERLSEELKVFKGN